MPIAVIGFVIDAMRNSVSLVIGAFLPLLAQWALASVLPFEAEFGLYWRPVLSAAAFGLVTAAAFAIWPLARAKEVSPAVMFRDLVAPVRRLPQPSYVAATVAAFALLAGLSIVLTPNIELALGFALGAAAAFLLLRATGWALMWFARNVPRPNMMMARLALSNIYRPGAPTPAVILSLGLGLTLLAAIALIDANIRRVMHDEIPAEAPSFFFVDIQTDQVAGFEKIVKGTKGVSQFEMVPMIRGRIVKLKDVPAEKAVVAREARWALNGDRGITYGNPTGARDQIVEGTWWPTDYKGDQGLVSFAEDLANGMGLKVGDMITVNVLGVEIPLKIANLRRVDFANARMNFIMIVSPGKLERAPHAHLATARVGREHEDEVERAVTAKFPNVSVVRVRETLETANDLVQQLAGGIRSASFLTLLTGLLVLAGALAAGHRHRLFDAVVLKVLGATKGQVMTTYLLEFAVLGVGAGFVAAILGTIAAWSVATFAMDTTFEPSWPTLVAVVAGGAVAAMGLGIAATWTALSTPAARTLRTA